MSVDSIKRICAVGAGAMGAGTALCFAQAGYDVYLYDLTDAYIQAGLKKIEASLDTFCKQGFVQKTDVPAILGRIKTTTKLEDAGADADFVIESVIEDLSAKQKIFAALDKICPPHTIFATNTSGLSPTAIAEAIERKDKFVVTHFWNPPQLIPLVEVVPGKHTSAATVETACALMTKIGKKPVPLKKESLGFVGNRLQAALLREAFYIVEQGIASPEDVDTVVKYSLGRRLSETGPLESADLGGLDVFKNIFKYLGPDMCSSTGVPALLDKVVGEGKFGAKTGHGLYAWPVDKLAVISEKRESRLFEHLKDDVKRKR